MREQRDSLAIYNERLRDLQRTVESGNSALVGHLQALTSQQRLEPMITLGTQQSVATRSSRRVTMLVTSMREQSESSVIYDERPKSLPRTVDSGDPVVLDHLQTPVSHQRLDPASWMETQPSPSASSVTPDVTLQKFRRHRYRVSMPRWLVNFVWDVTFFEYRGSWILQLRPVIIRPRGTFAFDFVRSGDIETIRRLLQSGELSLHDHEQVGGNCRNLLEVGRVLLEYRSDRFYLHLADGGCIWTS